MNVTRRRRPDFQADDECLKLSRSEVQLNEPELRIHAALKFMTSYELPALPFKGFVTDQSSLRSVSATRQLLCIPECLLHIEFSDTRLSGHKKSARWALVHFMWLKRIGRLPKLCSIGASMGV